MDDPSRLRRLIQVGCGVLAPLELDAVLRSVTDAAREITGAEYAALGVLDGSTKEVSRFITSGMEPDLAREIGSPPRGRGVLGELIRDPVPLRLADVGSHPRSFGFPPYHPKMSSFLGVPIMIRGSAYGNLYMTEKAGAEEFSDHDQEAAEILATWAAIAIEHAGLYADLKERQTALQQALRQLEAGADISKALDSETDLTRILELIVKRARALVEARTVAVFLLRGEELHLAAATGEMAERLWGMAHPLSGSDLGRAARSATPNRLQGPLQPQEGDLRGQLGAEAALLAPLQAHGEGLGVLVAFDRLADGPDFGEEDLRLLRAFASSAATAVAIAQTVEERRLRDRIEASERERHHWAHELHDETLQQLAAIRIKLATSLRANPTETEALAGASREAVEGLEREITALSRLISELRPIPLETMGLDQALESLAEESAERGDFEAEVSVAIETELSAEQERSIYRLVQESLNNVVKHSGAARASVSVFAEGPTLVIRIEDDGGGFDVSQTQSSIGLNGMRERIELLGGTLLLHSAPGDGTRVTARIPAKTPRHDA